MSYNEPAPEHRNAITQINEARQRAAKGVSEARKRTHSSPHPHLAMADGQEPNLLVTANQTVVDYLIQLRPYRHTSKKWQLDFGVVELPTQIPRDSPRMGEKRAPPLCLCRQPEVPLPNVSHIIDAVNMDVHYSTNKPTRTSASDTRSRLNRPKIPDNDTYYRIDPASHRGTFHVSRETAQKIRNGAISADEAVAMDMTLEAEQKPQEDEYVPAVPEVNNPPGDTRGHSDVMQTYKFVFGPQRLLHLVEMADEVASEMNLLIEMDEPDHTASGSGAV